MQLLLIYYFLLAEHLKFLHQNGAMFLQIRLVFDQVQVHVLHELLFEVHPQIKLLLHELDLVLRNLAQYVYYVHPIQRLIGTMVQSNRRFLRLFQRLLEIQRIDNLRPLVKRLHLRPRFRYDSRRWLAVGAIGSVFRRFEAAKVVVVRIKVPLIQRLVPQDHVQRILPPQFRAHGFEIVEVQGLVLSGVVVLLDHDEVLVVLVKLLPTAAGNIFAPIVVLGIAHFEGLVVFTLSKVFSEIAKLEAHDRYALIRFDHT